MPIPQEGSPDILAARAVAKFLGTEHIEAIFTPEMAFEVLEKVVYHMETYEPELIRLSGPQSRTTQPATWVSMQTAAL